jgi:Arc/MetJ family transcription regulator
MLDTYTLECVMRTNIEIDDELMKAAMKSAGVKTKRETVEAGLRSLLRSQSQAEFRKMRGSMLWEGNLEESRSGRVKE